MRDMERIANGEYAVLTVQYPPEGRNRRASNAEPTVRQFDYRSSKHGSKHCPVTFNPLDDSLKAPVLKKANQDPFELDLVVTVEQYTQVYQKKKETQSTELRFYREPFSSIWLNALVELFKDLPSKQRIVEAEICYQDIVNRKYDDRGMEKRATDVMGMNAFNAFSLFMLQNPSLKLSEDEIAQIKPEWCHIIMSAVCTPEMAQDPSNLCCAPKGLNDAMKVPEKMLMSLAEHYHHETVAVKVTLELVIATQILKSMEYEISVPNKAKITVMYEHPFKLPHHKYPDESIPHLEKVLGIEPEKSRNADYMYGL